MEAAPTPNPAISRPTYNTGRLSVGAACKTIPTQAMSADTINDHLRPNLSANGAAYSRQILLVNELWFICATHTVRDATKHPTCNVETTIFQLAHLFSHKRNMVICHILFSERTSFSLLSMP